ncbi:DUF4743 domain-containing protein [Pelagibius litoralis]|uniref:DUF4743 domain-containing protein n=1 Tax=Pelagibius litoralis TaxID=374515 RepID=A0A967F0X8_9PROT|nr:DUF4743 domain-containing protein [Pelagibius litoralis]NIA71133.1 DUF4743 domain-containing protein [Pelagibius litoralis]
MSYLDRIARCHRWNPGDYLPFLVDGSAVGGLARDFPDTLSAFPKVFDIGKDAVSLSPALSGFESRSAALTEVVGELRAAGAFPGWRGEDYAVSLKWGQAPLFRMERAAVPRFGLPCYGVHVNGFVRGRQGIEMWIGRRALDKPTAPGKLDHLTAGGQPYGLGLMENVIKECGEEAGVSPALAARALPVGAVKYRCAMPDGLRNDVAFCYDLELPADFVPQNSDGEVESFELWPMEKVLAVVRESEDFKFNVALVIIDFALRHGILTPDDEPDYQAIVEGLKGSVSG